jgi:phosphonate transport system substrate-binding protein
MSTASFTPSEKRPFSAKRVLTVLVPLATLLILFALYTREAIQADAQQQGERKLLDVLGLGKPTKHRLDGRFTDSDGDLVADPPKEESAFLDPEVLVFSYVGSKDATRQQDAWKEFVTALAAATEKKVEYLVLDSPNEELLALKEGRLHVAAVNTGNVPAAVCSCGFVPICTVGTAEGSYGYTVKIIVPRNSKITTVQDLRGKRIALTEPGSNSGYKAPLVLLMNDFDLVPQRDFEWSYTYGHNASIQGIADAKYDAAPVASDMLARAIGRGEIGADEFRVIYESEKFPPVALGYIYNLKPDLIEKITNTLMTFAWAGTGLEAEFGPSGLSAFVPVNYKNDWALIRRIDDAMGIAYTP